MSKLVRVMPVTLCIVSNRRRDVDLEDHQAIDEINLLLREAQTRRRRDPGRYRLRSYESPAAGLPARRRR